MNGICQDFAAMWNSVSASSCLRPNVGDVVDVEWVASDRQMLSNCHDNQTAYTYSGANRLIFGL